MIEETDWEEYEKILIQRPGFKEALNETLPEYEIAREKINVRIRRNKGGKIYGKDIEIKRKGRNRILGKRKESKRINKRTERIFLRTR